MAPKKGHQSNVQVFIRARPFNAREEADGEKGNVLTLQISGNSCRMLNPKKDMEAVREEFVFDYCFDSTKCGGRNDSQADVYGRLGPQVLENCLSGYNACIFAYGQTGSGKTYTMMGDIDDEQERGIIPRFVNQLVERIEAKKQTGGAATYKLEASYLEIYCERVKDLLVRDSPELQVRSTPEKGVFVDGLTSHKVSQAKDVYRLLNLGARNRAVACTNLNAHSSRSHAILILNYTETLFASSGEQKVQTRSRTSRVNLVDLAGSERVKLSGVTGVNLDEAKKINQSLTTLGRIIDLLADRKPGKSCTLPVRESTLTWLLGDSLGGNSRTIMLAAVSPSASSFEETLSTLRYAARTKCIVNETSINETIDMKLMEELRGQIDELQVMLKNQSDLESQLQTTEEKMAALQQLLEDERLAKERSDMEMKEQAEQEKRALEEKLQSEKEQLEQYLGKERQELQRKLADAQDKVHRLETACKSITKEAEHEKKMMKEHFESSMRELSSQASSEQRKLQDKVEIALRRASEIDSTLQTQSREKSALQAHLEEVQRKLSDVQHEASLKEQSWKHDRSLAQDKIEHTNKRLQDAENKLHTREIEWGKARDEMNARHEADLAKVQSSNQTKFTEMTQNHQQVLATIQRQNDERLSKLKEELKGQHDGNAQRLQQQHETAMKAARQQFEDERQRLKQQLEASSQELNGLKTGNKRQQGECQWLKEQLDHAQEEAKVAKQQHEEELERLKAKQMEALDQAKSQYDEECQRLVQQQGDAVKEAHKKRDTALQEMKKKVQEDMDKLKKVHDEKVTKMKAAHDEALSTLQTQVDATWERQRQEHAKAFANQSAQHAVELEEVERRLADAESRLLQKQKEVEMAEAGSAGFIRDLQEKFQGAERRHKEEISGLAQKLTTLHRLFEQQLEIARQTEEQLKTTQRRLEAARANGAREAQDCRLPQDLKWAMHGLKSPQAEGSPTSRRESSPRKLGTPSRGSFASPPPYSKELGLCKTPDLARRSAQKPMSIDSPAKRLLSTPKRATDEDDEGLLESIGSFNGGDNSCEKHPDHKSLELSLF